jgi:hypothetical protein
MGSEHVLTAELDGTPFAVEYMGLQLQACSSMTPIGLEKTLP